jgi:hypothetical protein
VVFKPGELPRGPSVVVTESQRDHVHVTLLEENNGQG